MGGTERLSERWRRRTVTFSGYLVTLDAWIDAQQAAPPARDREDAGVGAT